MLLKDTNLGRLILEAIPAGESTEKQASEKFDTAEANRIAAGLVKVASLPCKEEVYGSIQEIMKMAAACISEAVSSLESTQVQNTGLEKAAEIRVILEDMVNAGLIDENELEEKVAELMEKDAHQLEVIREAIKLSGKDGNVFFVNESEKTAGDRSEKVGMFDDVIDG